MDLVSYNRTSFGAIRQTAIFKGALSSKDISFSGVGAFPIRQAAVAPISNVEMTHRSLAGLSGRFAPPAVIPSGPIEVGNKSVALNGCPD